jgi:glycosyltransferase involved in cell wall biosynthesis
MYADDAPLRIALLAYRGKPHVGGQGVYVRHLAKALADLGHHVEVLGGQPYPELDPRVPLVELPSLDIYNDHFPMRMPGLWELKDWTDFAEVTSFSFGQFPEPLAFSLRAWRHLHGRRGEFDLVHDNQCLGYGLLAIERDGFPVLSTIHHPITVDRRLELEHAEGWYKRLTLRRWYSFTNMQTRVAKRMRRVVTVSQSSFHDIARDHQVDPNRMAIVPVGVDVDLFTPLPGVAPVPGRLITTASADVTMKGLSYLLEALAKLRTERDDAHLVVIGKRKPGGRSDETIRSLGLEDAVTFVTGVPDERIIELYSEAELAVVPSLYEGFSLPAIEAMSCGTPLVATSGGALPEVVGRDG